MSERREPFVAFVNPSMAQGFEDYAEGTLYKHEEHCAREALDGGAVPVVVTPLLPDDPRPGETWLDDGDEEVTIVTAPFDFDGRAAVIASTPTCGSLFLYLRDLRRPPVLKTFRIDARDIVTHIGPDRHELEIEAESKDAALKKLAAALEEVR